MVGVLGVGAGAAERFEDLENDVIADYVQYGRPEQELIWTLVFAESAN